MCFRGLLFRIGVITLFMGGAGQMVQAAPRAETAPAGVSEADEVWALLEQGESGVARDLFRGKADVNLRDSRGRTPLHMAAERGESELASFFISLGAEVDAGDNLGRTPLGISTEKRDSLTARVLVSGGAYIHQILAGGSTPALTAIKDPQGEFLTALLTPASLQAVDVDGRTILHLAADMGEVADIKTIITAGASLNKRDYAGKTPLDLAFSHTASVNYPKSVEALILAGGQSDDPIFAYFAPAVRSYNYNIRSSDGMAPLHYAAKEGHGGYITYLLDKMADINVKNASGTTPLHEAARAGHIGIMRTLIARGANINSQDAKGNSLLHTAIPPAVHREALSLLLSNGANPNLRDEHGDSPLHTVITLNRNADIIAALLEGGADVSIHNISGKTPLYVAVQENRAVYIPLLLRSKSDIFAADNDGMTPFELALRDELTCLTFLITEESVQQYDSGGNTALHVAVKNGAAGEIVGLILDKRALVNARNKDGDTSLHTAVHLNQRESGELLLSRGADIFAPNGKRESPIYLTFHSPGGVREWMLTPVTMEIRDGMGNSVLHYAAQWRLDAYISLLVQKGSNPDAANATGETPLFLAVKINSPGTIRALLQAGSTLSWRDSLGNTALHAAVRWNAPRAAEALITANIDLNVHALNGKTPLHDAVRMGIIDVENVLVRAGVNLEVRDNEGNTPFMEAVITGNPRVVERLANLGADPTVRNGRGDTPLHIAVATERSDLVTMLLSRGASIHAKNAMGRTPFQLSLSTSPRMVSTLLTKDRILSSDDDGQAPLHIAVLNEAPLNVIRVILDQGGRAQAVDAAGRTPLRMAVDKNNWEAAKLFADSGSDPFSTAGDGKTPASIAIASGIDAVKAIFSGRAIASKDVGGNTILHYAAQTGSRELIALLLDLGANKNSRNITAESPADMARRWNRPDLAALLSG
ncbi:hypothetical protein AGMMS50267_08830 [Spirochaetia bacterium]|nr:hypothetical protein AGMMS50267_08800 [Spirochaetia bacterium]GHV88523.1 hypothetical protein AGMMS50267_08830 [Spirochaetia bacterium]